MKTPITYYGGKQNMTGIILPLIPEHKVYCEPFFGGGAVFFAKEPAPVEIINDTNREVINFYRTVKNDFTSPEKEIRISLHSRDLHRQAKVVYQNPDMFSEIKQAWAFRVLANQSFISPLADGWSYDKTEGKKARSITKKRDNFTGEYAIRLQNTQIECADALQIIRSRDSENTFFYLDPPYVGTDMGHYDGYSQDDFDSLLQLLENVQGKFLLSSFHNKSLSEYAQRNKWNTLEIKMACSMTNRSKKPRDKVEVLTANFPISEVTI
jgi:DNA adenine methylase